MMSKLTAALSLIDAFGSEALAIFLLIIGIGVTRGWRGARRYHLIYAALKIPLVIFGALAWWWLMTSFVRGISSSMPPNPQSAQAMQGMSAGMGVFSFGWGVIALIYPISLLIVLRARTVREYFQSAVI